MTPPPDQPFDEDALLRALRSPGSAGELGEEERYVAMFREAQSSGDAAPVPLAPRRRRAVSRFGAGSAFVVVLTVGGSAAAAYTNNLPEPIQRFAHRALGPVAPPAPEPRQHRAQDRVTTAPTVSSSPTPTPTPTPNPTPTPRPSPSPSHHPSTAPASSTTAPTPSGSPAPTPTPTATPSSEPTPTPTPTPTATPTSTPTVTPPPPPPPSAASVGISGSTHKVEPGQSVAFAGTVADQDGDPLARARVTLQARTGSGWVPVTSGRTDASGQVTLVLPPISATTGVRLRTASVHSARWRVTLHPELAVGSAAGSEPGTVVITATAVGAQPGDAVQLMSAAGVVASGTLDAGGSVSFTVTPTAKKTRYVVLLPGTTAHGPGRVSITVIVKKPAGPTTG